MITEQGVERVVEIFELRHVDLESRPPAALNMTSSQWRAARERNTDIEKIGIFHRPCAEHAVGIDHRVGLSPDDLLAFLRYRVEEIGRTRECGARTHINIRVTQLARRLSK